MADDSGQSGLRERIARQGEDALGKVAQELLENPLVNSAITRAFDARERAAKGWIHADDPRGWFLGLVARVRQEGVSLSLKRLKLSLDGTVTDAPGNSLRVRRTLALRR